MHASPPARPAPADPDRRRQLSLLVGLGLGAGLDGRDLRHVHREDLREAALPDGTPVLTVTVCGGDRPRTLVVRRTYEALVRDGLRAVLLPAAGHLPVPARAGLLPAEAVVDLDYRATADRATLTQRLASLTDPARLQLRYALARMDSLRTPDLGAELEAAVGQRITSVDPPNSRRQTIELSLSDGSTLSVLPRPAAPAPTGPGRSRQP